MRKDFKGSFLKIANTFFTFHFNMQGEKEEEKREKKFPLIS
jgi:hypothetical protein